MLNVREKVGAIVQLTGTWAGTVQWEGTLDGANWVTIRAYPLATGTAATTATTTGLYWIPSLGLHGVRANVTAYTSGTITAVAEAIRRAVDPV
jgi:hypothetical protein